MEPRSNRDGDVVVAWVVKDVDKDHKGRVPEHEDTGGDVGHQHAGEDEVSLGPESGRQPDRVQRESVAAQVEYGHNE